MVIRSQAAEGELENEATPSDLKAGPQQSTFPSKGSASRRFPHLPEWQHQFGTQCFEAHEPVGGMSYSNHSRHWPDRTVALLVIRQPGRGADSLHSLKGTLLRQPLPGAFKMTDRELSV